MAQISAEKLSTLLPGRLNRHLRKGLTAAMVLCAQGETGSGLTPEVFLCGLYLRYGRKILKFFESRQGFAHLLANLCRNRGHGVTRWSSLRPQGTGLWVSADKELLNLLWRAAKLSAALGRKAAGIPDLVGALALDDELAARLKDKGFVLKGRVEPPA